MYGYQLKNFLNDQIIVPKDIEFYEECNKLRHYFYVIDLKGQIHLESNQKRNIASSIKDIKVQNFIIKNIQINTTQLYPEIPYLSLCGKEKNFITCIDPYSVFVFKDLVNISTLPNNDKQPLLNNIIHNWKLIYGGDLIQSFDPNLLAYNISNGRIYHKITNQIIRNDFNLSKKEVNESCNKDTKDYYGLLASHIISQYLLDNIIRNDYIDMKNLLDNNSNDNTKEKEIILNWNPCFESNKDCDVLSYKMKILE